MGVDWTNIKTRSGYTQPGWCSDCEQAGELHRYRYANGVWHAHLICPDCREKLSGSIAREELAKQSVILMELPEWKPEPSRWERVPACPKCGQHPQMGKVRELKQWAAKWYCRICSVVFAPVTDTQLKAWHRKAEELPEVESLILKAMDYDDYLQSSHWARISFAMKWLSGFKCQMCGETEFLQVHHNTYERRGRERPEDLIVLCRSCHAKHHNKEAA